MQSIWIHEVHVFELRIETISLQMILSDERYLGNNGKKAWKFQAYHGPTKQAAPNWLDSLTGGAIHRSTGIAELRVRVPSRPISRYCLSITRNCDDLMIYAEIGS